MEIKENLFALSNLDAVASVTDASDLAFELLSKYTKTERLSGLSVIGFLKGESDYTLMLDAHIDQISMVVTDVDSNGFLTVSNAGGIDIRALPSRRVTVYGKEKINAVFCSTPPHLSSKEKEYGNISELKIDTLLGDKARDIVSVGDVVCFSGDAFEMTENTLCGRSFDDRAGVACVIEVAKRLKDEKLPFNVAFVLSDGEELGLRGTKTATFKVVPQEAIAIDVSFGDALGVSEEECGKLGEGGMIGISPALDGEMSKKLISLAKENSIPYQIEVMGEKTGTNADAISVSRQGVKACTLSIPLRNMHTDCEILNLKDLDAVCSLICRYILAGGMKND